MTLAQVKTFFRTQIKVVTGGPTVGTPGQNRAAGVLAALDKLAEFAAELVANSGGSGGGGTDRTPVVLPFAASVALDFAGPLVRTLALSADCTLTTANLAAGRQLELRLTNTSPNPHSLTVPAAWHRPAGTSWVVPVGAVLRVTLEAFGTTNAEVDAGTVLLS